VDEHDEHTHGEIPDQGAPAGAGSGSGAQDAGAAHPDARRAAARRVAAAICGVEALVLLGFVVFYLWEIAQGRSDDAVRAVVSALLIAVFGVALAFLARAWLRGAGWPNTPTIVWNLLLLPVAWSLLTSGHGAVGALMGAVAVVGVAAAALAKEPAGGEPSAGGE
jgi:hypothetical protein